MEVDERVDAAAGAACFAFEVFSADDFVFVAYDEFVHGLKVDGYPELKSLLLNIKWANLMLLHYYSN